MTQVGVQISDGDDASGVFVGRVGLRLRRYRFSPSKDGKAR